MESSLAAEAFPEIYRVILDGVAELERVGQRTEAQRVRKAATTTYSGAWGEAGYRRLQLLVARIERSLGDADRRRPDRARRERPLQAVLSLPLIRRLPSTR